LSFVISDYFILFIVAFIVSSIFTPAVRVIAIRFNVIDSPNQDHKTHAKPIPYLGGIAIVIATLTTTYGIALLTDFSRNAFVISTTVFVPALILSVVGLIDDVRDLKPLPRFVVQNVIGIASSIFLVKTETLGSPFNNSLIDFLVTLFWLVALMNSINFFDNIDGGAAGTVTLISITLSVMAFINGQFFIAALSAVLAGSTTGFLLFNKLPARIYMGDAGSLFLGTLIGALTIRLDSPSNNPVTGFVVLMLLMAIPLLDTAVVVIDRLRRRVSPFKGGRDHLSHRLIRKGMPRNRTILTLWSLSGSFSLMALASFNSTATIQLYVAAIGLIILALLFIYFMRISTN
jgi:UDP-GlcNAc:undecaprenyl-phosphate GlcNAc-1-phosphate transferase